MRSRMQIARRRGRLTCAGVIMAVMAAMSVATVPLAPTPTYAQTPAGRHAASAAIPAWTVKFATAACALEGPVRALLPRVFNEAGPPSAKLAVTREGRGVLVAHILFEDHRRGVIALRFPGTARALARLQITGAGSAADLMVQTGDNCTLNEARVLEKRKTGAAERLSIYRQSVETPASVETFDPPVPQGRDPGGVAIALIDAGINYQLKRFAARLARDQAGVILGHDFADDDARPFDLDPSRSALFPLRHGTATASVLLREAPKVRLIPLRHPGRDTGKFADIVAHIAKGPARIAMMPLGGARKAEWLKFRAAAQANPDILFIVSAGNNGRDIDQTPVYPASFTLDNLLVVTSSDRFGRLPAESNWGAETVDIAVPGERIEVIDHRGAKGQASGTSYAVPRVTALAARLKAHHPGWPAARIKQAIIGYAAPMARADKGRTRHGWLPNPALADRP